MKNITIQLETLTCPSCSTKIEGALKQLSGVENDSLKISFNTSKAKLSYDEQILSIEAIQAAIEKVGYEVLSIKER